MRAREPILNVPRAVTLSAGAMIAMQLVLGLLPLETGIRVFLGLAMIPARYMGAAAELPGGYVSAVTSFVTYSPGIEALGFVLLCCAVWMDWRRARAG